MAKRTTPLGTEIDDKEYSKKIKEQRLWVFLKIDVEGYREKFNKGIFSIDDLVYLMFPLSEKKRKIAKDMILYIKKYKSDINKRYLKVMMKELGYPTSTAWQVYLCLKRAGVLVRKNKTEPIALSEQFARFTQEVADWWRAWVKYG
ncbi:hypothetical protein DRN75_02460 [Nanoarchaeota archaeon]|nr:MAG: hypothetical protein DRN75_02460 [Nanoarchaeota archaeon]